ncbi:hypothetical protein ACQ0QQ_17220 [Lysinibacillus sphaericus]
MKNLLGVILALLLIFIPINVDAHITNEKNLYEDIAASEASEEIVYLRSMNAITAEEGVNLFRPLEKLTREDLALWAVNFNSQSSSHHENGRAHSPEMAVDRGLIDSIQGNATLEDINKAYFNKTLKISNNKEITREEFALFMGEHFLTEVNGKNLFIRSGLSDGPTGIIEDIVTSENDEMSKLSINGKEYSLSHHPKFVNGTTDMESLKGHKIDVSYTRRDEKGEDILELIKFTAKESTGELSTEKEKPVSAANDVNKDGDAGLLTFLWVPLVVIIMWFVTAPIFRKFKRND